jgi:ABC-type sugar transport system ATPase subunit
VPRVEFEQIAKRYDRLPVLHDVSTVIEDGRFNVVLGPPGSGKSVLLRLLAGLEPVDGGRVLVDGRDVADLSPGERNIGYVPQSFALYPHYRVFDNIAYPLTLAGVPKRDAEPAVRRIAEMLRIDALLGQRPDQLSGGEKQRVAIARGLVKDTTLFVLDDPLTGLDFKLREQLFDDLREMRQTLGATFIYTTSDPLESLILADDVHVLSDGRIVEAGPVADVYHAPRHLRSAELLSFPRTNVLGGTLREQGGQLLCHTDLFEVAVTREASEDGAAAAPREVRVCVRPEHLVLGGAPVDGLVEIPVRVVLGEDLGGELVVHVDARDLRLVSVVRHDRGVDLDAGDLTARVAPESILVYDAVDQRRVASGGALPHG